MKKMMLALSVVLSVGVGFAQQTVSLEQPKAQELPASVRSVLTPFGTVLTYDNLEVQQGARFVLTNPTLTIASQYPLKFTGQLTYVQNKNGGTILLNGSRLGVNEQFLIEAPLKGQIDLNLTKETPPTVESIQGFDFELGKGTALYSILNQQKKYTFDSLSKKLTLTGMTDKKTTYSIAAKTLAFENIWEQALPDGEKLLTALGALTKSDITVEGTLVLPSFSQFLEMLIKNPNLARGQEIASLLNLISKNDYGFDLKYKISNPVSVGESIIQLQPKDRSIRLLIDGYTNVNDKWLEAAPLMYGQYAEFLKSDDDADVRSLAEKLPALQEDFVRIIPHLNERGKIKGFLDLTFNIDDVGSLTGIDMGLGFSTEKPDEALSLRVDSNSNFTKTNGLIKMRNPEQLIDDSVIYYNQLISFIAKAIPNAGPNLTPLPANLGPFLKMQARALSKDPNSKEKEVEIELEVDSASGVMSIGGKPAIQILQEYMMLPK